MFKKIQITDNWKINGVMKKLQKVKLAFNINDVVDAFSLKNRLGDYMNDHFIKDSLFY